jgi:hypothetical protein
MQRLTSFVLTILLVLACGQPDLLIGSWSNRQPSGGTTLVFEEGGAFVLTAQMAIAGKGVVRGLWKRRGDQLELRFQEREGFLAGFQAFNTGEPVIFEIVTLDESRFVWKDSRSGAIANYTRVSRNAAS